MNPSRRPSRTAQACTWHRRDLSRTTHKQTELARAETTQSPSTWQHKSWQQTPGIKPPGTLEMSKLPMMLGSVSVPCVRMEHMERLTTLLLVSPSATQ
jgi:hypothetical protein